MCETLDGGTFRDFLHSDANFPESLSESRVDSGPLVEGRLCSAGFHTGLDTVEPALDHGSITIYVATFDSGSEAHNTYDEVLQTQRAAVQDVPESSSVEWVFYKEDDLEGDWDAAHVFSGSSRVHEVHAYARNETYIFGVEVQWAYDPNVYRDLKNGEPDIYEDPWLPFTVPELTEWAIEEYLPELHDAIIERASE